MPPIVPEARQRHSKTVYGRYTQGRKTRVVRAPRSPCSVWTGIVPPCPSYPQRITLWTTCEKSVDLCAQPAPPRLAQAAPTADNPSETRTWITFEAPRRNTGAVRCYPPGIVDNGAPAFTHRPGGIVAAFSAPPVPRLDTLCENRLNGGFCDAAGDHVCASPGLASTVACKHVRPQASRPIASTPCPMR